MKIFPLSEGSFTIDKTKIFIPFDLGKDNLQDRARGSLLVEVQPFLIETKNDLIVLDTGLGFKNNNGILQIHQNIADAGFDAMDVTKVILSHLHKDHAGGIEVLDEISGQKFLTFPNAKYYVSKAEIDFALNEGNRSYHPEDFEFLLKNDHLEMLGESGMIGENIRYEEVGGHCPHHLAIWIEEDGETVFFGADVAPQLQQMKNKFIAKYDTDGRKSMELRQKWWEEGREKGWTFIFYHDIKTPTYK